jgi:hypothetical protein
MVKHVLDVAGSADSLGFLYRTVYANGASPQETLRNLADVLDQCLGFEGEVTVRWRSEPTLVFHPKKGWSAYARFTVSVKETADAPA